MREIKFRVIEELSNRSVDPGIHYYTLEELIKQFFVTNYKILGYYTGLKDKNGKEIYEGDIVKIIHFGQPVTQGPFIKNETLHEVVFEDGSFVVKRSCLLSFSNNVEVVGNIYENKELLKNE